MGHNVGPQPTLMKNAFSKLGSSEPMGLSTHLLCSRALRAIPGARGLTNFGGRRALRVDSRGHDFARYAQSDPRGDGPTGPASGAVRPALGHAYHIVRHPDRNRPRLELGFDARFGL